MHIAGLARAQEFQHRCGGVALVQHIVHHHQAAAGKIRLLLLCRRTQAGIGMQQSQVVTVALDLQLDAFDRPLRAQLRDSLVQAFGQWHAATLQSDQGQRCGIEAHRDLARHRFDHRFKRGGVIQAETGLLHWKSSQAGPDRIAAVPTSHTETAAAHSGDAGGLRQGRTLPQTRFCRPRARITAHIALCCAPSKLFDASRPACPDTEMTAPITLHPDALALLNTLDQSQPGSSAKLIRLFAADAPALLSRIELGHERRDVAEINQAAHFLRSSALALGATDLADAAFRLEHMDASQFGGNAAELRLAQLRVCLRDTLLGLLELSLEG